MKWVVILLPVLVGLAVFAVCLVLVRKKSPRVQALAEILGFRKADEMDQQIQNRSVRIAYFVLLLLLVVEIWYTGLVKGEQSLSTPMLAVAVVVQAVSELVLRRRAVEGDEEYRSRPIWILLAVVLAVTAVVTSVGCLLLFKGVGIAYGG